jgi:hypothetical protein
MQLDAVELELGRNLEPASPQVSYQATVKCKHGFQAGSSTSIRATLCSFVCSCHNFRCELAGLEFPCYLKETDQVTRKL